MEFVTGFPLLLQQFKALFKKNLLLSWRNKPAMFLQLFSSLFFMFLLFFVQKATEAKYARMLAYKDIKNPETTWAPPIPPCEDRFFIKEPCLDFVWSGNGSSIINSIVQAMMENNPGRPIPPEKVKSFTTEYAVDEWVFKNPMRTPGAVHFVVVNSTIIRYGLEINSTAPAWRGRTDDLAIEFQVPLQIAAEREIARSILGAPNFSWNVGFTEFAHPAEPLVRPQLDVFRSVLFLAFVMFGFVLQLSNLVVEKELKLCQAMDMTGLYKSAYWISWIIWEGITTAISSLFAVLFGLIFQFDFFKKNSFGVLFLVFFLFMLSMTGFAFLLSAFISKASSGTKVGFIIFIFSSLAQMFASLADNLEGWKRFVWFCFPPNLLLKAVEQLSVASDTPQDHGISWEGRLQCPSASAACRMTINDVYMSLIYLFVAYTALAIYLDNVFPNASGVRKSLFYFLMPSYWTGKDGDRIDGGICSCIGGIPRLEHITPEDEDVLREENKVKQDVRDGKVGPDIAVQIRGLVKTFPGTTQIGCCKCKRTSPYHAVKGLWLNFTKDQLFCLLGPNGAGKTTTISCLTGITPATDGDALVYGQSIRSSVGMSAIRRMIGVCPQFDILWDALSGEEHLYLFANIKGLPQASIASIVEDALENVRLTQSAKVRSRSYSGGMRRRLSVAIALLGDPKLVILDEPTTGMDPISRRQVWDIIEKAKKGRAIVLTTHSMEEADVLSDRIGIVAKGRLRCIGNSIILKSKFGTGFVVNVNFSENKFERPIDRHRTVTKFFKDHLNVDPAEKDESFLTFVIPHYKEKLLTKLFKDFEPRQREFGVSEIQLSLATLEEVFLNIAKQAELESATAEGRMVTLTLRSGISLEIPMGAKFIAIPRTESPECPKGVMVQVYWEQDDSGSLCISGHSPEMPTPYNVRPMSVGAPVGDRGRKREPLYGIPIDPDAAAM